MCVITGWGLRQEDLDAWLNKGKISAAGKKQNEVDPVFHINARLVL